MQGPLQGFSIVGGPALAIGRRLLHRNLLDHESNPRRSGSYGGLFAGFGFAYLPAVFTVPVTFMALQLDSFAQGLSGFIGFGIAVWTIVLSVFAVQANNNFSTGRAIAAVFIPLAVFFVLLLALFAFVVIMILIALNERRLRTLSRPSASSMPPVVPHPRERVCPVSIWGEGQHPLSLSASSVPSVVNPLIPSPVVGESLPRTRYGDWGEGTTPPSLSASSVLSAVNPPTPSPVAGEACWGEGENPPC